MSNFLYDSYTILTNIYLKTTYIKQAINQSSFDPKFKSLSVKIVYGVVENDTYLEYIISALSKKPPKSAIKIILKQALYLIKFTNKPPYTVTNEAVDLVKKLGKGGVSGFVNAVLRKAVNQKVPLPNNLIDRLSVQYSYPKFAIKKLIESYGENDTKAIISYKTDLKCIRKNMRISGNLKYDFLIDTPFENAYFVKNFSMDESFFEGAYTFQSIGSIAVCNVISPCDSLLDACAAPGGKSVYLSEKCKVVTAFDIYPHRVELIKSYINRMGAANVHCHLEDSTKFNQKYHKKFDAVLCDVPCSGLGVAHENPDIKLNKTEKQVNDLNKIQLNILRNCAKYLKDGGMLYYSTCSILQCENDGIIDKFLNENKGFSICKIDSLLNYKRVKYGLQFLPQISFGAGFYVCALKHKENV